jgi:hypothetical protein
MVFATSAHLQVSKARLLPQLEKPVLSNTPAGSVSLLLPLKLPVWIIDWRAQPGQETQGCRSMMDVCTES